MLTFKHIVGRLFFAPSRPIMALLTGVGGLSGDYVVEAMWRAANLLQVVAPLLDLLSFSFHLGQAELQVVVVLVQPRHPH